MGRTRQVLVPSIDFIIEVNRRFIVLSGEEYIGTDNLLNRRSLEYVLQAITDPIFGVDAFPSIFQKAAAIAERIIVNHVFYGANKRTGLLACIAFLELNGWDMALYDEDRFDQEALNAALKLQEKQMTVDEFVEWLKSRSTSQEVESSEENSEEQST